MYLYSAFGLAGRGSGALDTQTVTVSQIGTSPNRVRGSSAISPGTTTIGGGSVITDMTFDETTGNFTLTITGASDSGWTTMTNTTDSKTLTRAARNSFSGGTWTWTGQGIAGFFANSSGNKTVTFA